MGAKGLVKPMALWGIVGWQHHSGANRLPAVGSEGVYYHLGIDLPQLGLRGVQIVPRVL